MSLEEFQDSRRGGHLRYWNETILAILGHCDASYQVLAQSDLRFGRRCRSTILILERNDFSNSESLYHCDASHQVSAQSDLGFGGRYRLKNFKMRLSWILERNEFRNSESLCHCDASHQVLAQSNLRFGWRCRLKNFKMAAVGTILDIRTERF